jgi:hypothetical protein
VLTTPVLQVFVDANGQLGTLTPPLITATGTATLMPPAVPSTDLALLQRLAAQDGVIAELRARLVQLEAQVERLARRR